MGRNRKRTFMITCRCPYCKRIRQETSEVPISIAIWPKYCDAHKHFRLVEDVGYDPVPRAQKRQSLGR